MKIALGGALYAISGNINSVEEAARYAESLYCTVLYCTVLYCTVLYCTVLYCTGTGRCSRRGAVPQHWEVL